MSRFIYEQLGRFSRNKSMLKYKERFSDTFLEKGILTNVDMNNIGKNMEPI